MSITRKTDVKNHLSARPRTQNRSYRAANLLGLSNLSATSPAITARISSFSEDFLGEHSPRRTSIVPVNDSTGIQEAEASKSPQE
jgi:hypothetical protein